MPKRLSSTAVIRVLKQHGYSRANQKGSHAKFKNSTGRIAVVPHPKKELPIGTTRSIIRQAGLTPADFGL
jgi:predicted RNA binding protein YcfA (HicA-like mRNA interferase family)